MEGPLANKQTRTRFIIIVSLAILIAAAAAYYSSKQPDEIIPHKGFTYCWFTKWISGAKGFPGSIQFYYEYHNKTYIKYLPAYNCNYNTMIGRRFLIVLDTLEPQIFHVLIGPKDYRYAGLAFPDSMKWVYSLCDTAYTH